MSKAYFTVSQILIFAVLVFIYAGAAAAEEEPIVITSQVLTADNKKNVAVFEGSVVAKSGDIVINCDKMEILYSDSNKEITKIRALGNVTVNKKERTIFSKEATYFWQEDKIVFTGDPKAVEGENVITGTEIVYFLKENRSIIKGSHVVIKNKKE
jgi:lipopolysaccharide export system protein LptA